MLAHPAPRQLLYLVHPRTCAIHRPPATACPQSSLKSDQRTLTEAALDHRMQDFTVSARSHRNLRTRSMSRMQTTTLTTSQATALPTMQITTSHCFIPRLSTLVPMPKPWLVEHAVQSTSQCFQQHSACRSRISIRLAPFKVEKTSLSCPSTSNGRRHHTPVPFILALDNVETVCLATSRRTVDSTSIQHLSILAPVLLWVLLSWSSGFFDRAFWRGERSFRRST